MIIGFALGMFAIIAWVWFVVSINKAARQSRERNRQAGVVKPPAPVIRRAQNRGLDEWDILLLVSILESGDASSSNNSNRSED